MGKVQSSAVNFWILAFKWMSLDKGTSDSNTFEDHAYHHGTCVPHWCACDDIGSSRGQCRLQHYTNQNTLQELLKKCYKELNMLIWLQNSPELNLIKHLWGMPKILRSSEVPLCNRRELCLNLVAAAYEERNLCRPGR